jgi:hypothetical protein
MIWMRLLVVVVVEKMLLLEKATHLDQYTMMHEYDSLFVTSATNKNSKKRRSENNYY